MASPFADFMAAAFSSGIGSLVGTAIRLIKEPPNSLVRWFGESFIRIAVGTFAGAITSEWFQAGPWVSSSVAAIGAYLADEIIRTIDRNGERLKKVEPPIPFEKD